MENQELIRVEMRDSGLLWVTLNTPPLNLQSLESMERLEKILDYVEKDATIHALVLTGSGDRVFCAGSDVKEFPALRQCFVEAKLRRENDVFSRLSELPIPTIAALNGAAMGGGLELALCCDFRILAKETQIGFPEINLGNFPGSGGPMRLVRLIGPARAFELMTLGTSLTGDTAKALGLVHKVVPKDELESSALVMAKSLMAVPSDTFARWKELIYAAVFETSAQAIEHAQKSVRAVVRNVKQ